MLWFAFVGILFATWFVVMPVYFGRIPGLKQSLVLAAKATPTLLAAIAALIACVRGGGQYALLVTIALFVCAAADVMLGVKFVVGGVLFFSGHMLYLTALGGVQTPTVWSIPVFVIAVALLWLFCRRYFSLFPSKWLYLGVMIYCMALGALLAFSLPAPVLAFSRRTVLAAMGAALFVLSDMGTCHAMLAKPGRTFNYLSLGVYYTAQMLLAFSAFA